MSQLTYSDIEIARLGQDIYAKIRSQVELVENIGKIIAIDVHTSDYEIGNDLLMISHQLKSRQPNAEMWAERIGFNAVYDVMSSVQETLYLLSVPGMRESLQEGLATSIKECDRELEW